MSEAAEDLWWPEGAKDAASSSPSVPEKGRGMAFLLRSISPSALFYAARHAAQQAIDIIYPPSCISCLMSIGAAGGMCPACWRRVRFIERPYCERLGTPFAQDLGDGLISPEAFADPPVFSRARAVTTYDEGPARDLVHNLKYGDRLELAEPMALWMARAGVELTRDADVIVPIPLHRRRLFQRRFNQAAELAREIARQSQRPFDPFALIRVKQTTPQVGLTRAQRAQNVQGAFRVPDEARDRVRGRNILLVDDVLTTGATLNAAARVMLRAGASRVDVLVFARVVRDGQS